MRRFSRLSVASMFIFGVVFLVGTMGEALAVASPQAESAIHLRAATTTITATGWHISATYPGMTRLDSVACPSLMHCTAIGNIRSSNPASNGPIITTTINGGATWKRERPPTTADGLQAVACPSVTDCTVVGSNGSIGAGASDTLIATTNGGVTWKSERPPAGVFDLSLIACPSTSDCTALGVGNNLNLAIINTTDGGVTWTTERPPRGSYDLAAIACPSKAHCTAVGYSNSNGSDSIITTSDGGAIWTNEHLAPGVSDHLFGIACPSAADCTAVGYNGSGTIGTTDGGATWMSESAPAGVHNLSPAYGFNAVACPSTADCTAVGYGTDNGSDTIITTTDGGVAWTSQRLPSAGYELKSLACPSISSCVAVGWAQSSSHPSAFILSDTRSISPASAPSTGRFILPPANPPRNIMPVPNFIGGPPCESVRKGVWTCSNRCITVANNGVLSYFNDSLACTDEVLSAIDHARSLERVGPMILPHNWQALSPQRQLFILADLERVGRGLPPYLGLVSSLSTVAQRDALASKDPSVSAGFASKGTGGAWSNVPPIEADYMWMYSDGWGGVGHTANALCTSNPTYEQCWGHRDQLLSGAGLRCTDCVMGTGYVPRAMGYASSVDLVVKPAGAVPRLAYTWADALAAGARD